ncbi:MAG TPA: glutathione transferase [Polyangia bacterium]|nr:glutathione transferase [Polyangia bacterium]
MVTPGSPRLVLYGNTMWSSPYVLSCFVALTEKQLPFEVQTVALHEGAHRSPAYVETSFTARVPALVDGDFSLSESSAIVEYLDERWPAPGHAPLLPRDLRQRARARQIMAWVRSDLGPLREERSSEYVFYPHDGLPAYAPLSPVARRAADKLIGLAERLVPQDGGPLFGGWSIADTDLAMMLQRLLKTDGALPAHLRSFAEREWRRPSVQAFVDKPRPPHRPAQT